MKKGELKTKIQDGFSELAPDVFDAVMKEIEIEPIQITEKQPLKEKKFFGHFYRTVMPAGVVLVLACLMLFMIFSGQKETLMYVALDVNPGIQLVLNETYEVKDVKGLNKDGEWLLTQLEWKKKDSLHQVLEVFIFKLTEYEYLKKDAGMLVTISAIEPEKVSELETILANDINANLEKQQMTGVKVAFYTTGAGKDNQGRKELEKQLMLEWGLKQEQVQNMSVGELIQYCEENTTIPIQEIKEKEQSINQQEQVSEEEQNAVQSAEPDVEHSEEKEEDEKVTDDTVSKSDDFEEEKEDIEIDSFPKEETNGSSDFLTEEDNSVKEESNGKDNSQKEENNGKDNPQKEENNGKDNPQKEENSGKDNSQKEENNGKDNSQKEENNGKDNSQKEENSGKDNSQKEENSGKDNSQKEENSGKDNSQKEENSGKDNSQKEENNGKGNSQKEENNGKDNSQKGENNGNHYGNDTEETEENLNDIP